jgi:hypothetical protein
VNSLKKSKKKKKLDKVFEEKINALYRNGILYGWICSRKTTYYVVERTSGPVELIKTKYID